MKKYAFFKYFIKNKVFAGGGRGVGAGLGVQFLPLIWFGDGGGCMEAGRGRGYSNPSPIRPVAVSSSST